MTTFKYLIGTSSFYQRSLEGRGGPAVAVSELLQSDGLPLQMHLVIFVSDLSDAVRISEAITSYNVFCGLKCGYLAAIPP